MLRHDDTPNADPTPARVDVRSPEDRRLPPGQILTRKWPVLHFGTVPKVDLATWRFEVTGAVEQPYTIGWNELRALARRETVCDIHCVTRWSRYDNTFEHMLDSVRFVNTGNSLRNR